MGTGRDRALTDKRKGCGGHQSGAVETDRMETAPSVAVRELSLWPKAIFSMRKLLKPAGPGTDLPAPGADKPRIFLPLSSSTGLASREL